MGQVLSGYFQADGRFIPDNTSVSIPVMRKVSINILDDDETDKNIIKQKRTMSFDEFFIEAEKAENDLTNEDWEMFENLRSQTDFSRKVHEWFTP